MPWLFSCIKPSTRDEDRQGRHGGSHQNSSRESKKRNHAENRIVTYVELLRHLDEPLGLVLQGGKDQEIPVYIEALRPGGVAQKSGTLQAGDRVQAINGIATDRLTQREVVSLLKSAGTIINLEVSYEMPPGYDDKSRDDVLFKVMVVQLFREGSSFGFTIRGGREENRPITIAHIVPNTMVYRAGMVKVGDRVLQINGCSMKDASQLDALTILRGASDSVTMEIEYEAELQDEKLRHATDPLLVKVLKPPMSSFGISLSGLSHPGDPIWITEVKEGCIADRCGALHVGDQLLSINNCILDNCTVWEATNYLISSDIHMELQIMPAHNFTTRPGFANCLTSDSILLCQNSNMSQSRYPSSTSLATSYHGINPLTSHPETMTVEVIADDVGFGMKLRGGATDHHNHPITIAEIIPDGPAMRLGQLKAGDRVLAINDVPMEGVTLHAALKIAHEMTEAVNMEIEIDVEDPIMPASGSFDMKLVKMGMSLGITVNGAQTPGAPVWISDMKKGGAAYRTGRLRAGDIITAINGQSCEYVTLSDAVSMLRNTDDVVHLRISKDSNNFRAPQAENSDTVTYSVQLDKDNQQLGIVLGMSGNSVVIKSLTDGVARRTGTVKVGNHILAINGENLSGKTLLQIEDMLNNCGNSVTLKIRKNVKSKARSKQPSPVGKESWKDSPNLRPKVLGTLPSRPMLESASSQLSSERRDSVTSDNIHELTTMQRSTNFPTTLPSTSNYTSGETDTNRGSFTETEDEMTSLDDEGLEQTSGKSQNLVGSLDTAHYYTAPHRSGSRISQIPFARAQLKRESQSLSRRKQPEDLEETSFSEEAFQQIKCALDKSGKYLPRFSKIAEHSSSDPDSDYEPSHRGRHRLPPRYVSAKFTQHTQHKVKLVRTDRSSDFGFSISDSALEPGIYIHKVKPGGGAEQNGLKSYDRILKINQHTVRDLDCSRALPLLAKSGNEVSLVVSRSAQPTNRYTPALQNEEI